MHNSVGLHPPNPLSYFMYMIPHGATPPPPPTRPLLDGATSPGLGTRMPPTPPPPPAAAFGI